MGLIIFILSSVLTAFAGLHIRNIIARFLG